MSYGDPDPYNQPEKFDLQPVAEIDYSDGNYCFDIRVVWRHKSGKLYTARDSGCSCPSPFESYKKLTDLQDFNAEVLIEEARSEAKGQYYRGGQVAPFITKINELRKEVSNG